MLWHLLRQSAHGTRLTPEFTPRQCAVHTHTLFLSVNEGCQTCSEPCPSGRKISGLSTFLFSFTSCTHLWCSLHAWEGQCRFWLLRSSPCSPVLSSLLLKHVEAVGINTGKCRANWQKETLTSCASTLGYGVWVIQLKPWKEVWKDTDQEKNSSWPLATLTAGICAKWKRYQLSAAFHKKWLY